MADVTNEIQKSGLSAYFQGKLPEIADYGLKILIAMLVFFIGTRLIKWALKLLRKSLERVGMEEGSVYFLLSLVKALMYLFLAAVIATYLGVKEASIVALIGSMGVGVALALKESLGNLAGGVVLLLMKPFQVGDYIKEEGNDSEGTVDKIGLFYTSLITPENQTISIPNGSLSNMSLTNLSRQSKRQLRLLIGISYKSDIKTAKAALEHVLKEEEAVLKEEPIEVFVDSFQESSVQLGFRAWVRPEDYWPTRWRVLENVKYELEKNKIEIPYKQMDLHILQDERE